MKRYLNKSILLIGSGLILLSSCNKNQTLVTFTGGQSPVLNATASDSIPLPISDTTSQAVTFSWTNPDYTFSDGISSLNVTYYLQFDTSGANFTSPNMQTVGITSDLSTSFTVSTLNTLLANGLLLATGVSHNLEVRIESFIQPNSSGTAPAGVLYSNTLSYTVTPYAPPPTVTPPSSGTLYITGSATNDGWMVGGNPASVAGQELSQQSPTVYSITLPLIGGQQFLLVPVAGDWSNKYATASSSSSTSGGTFSYNASNNFNGPASSGTYTVTFNFQTGVYTITQ
jgi:hypothetical protein